MVFSSIIFIFRFLPIFLLVYFLVPVKYKNVTILLGSLFFYAYGEPRYLFIMVLSILINHFFAGRIYDANEREGNAKGYVALAVLVDLGVLFFFKYYNFFTEIVDSVAGRQVLSSVDNLSLPLGISFYTFQMISYIVDVYRRKYVNKAGFINFAAYVSMFPQLIAGPIVNYEEVEHRLNNPKVSLKNMEYGMTIFIMGLAYKVLLANNIASLWNDVLTPGVKGINTLTAWLGAWGYSMQIYFDFFGYSLMAIGLGAMLGFKLPSNFINPYTVKSATTFWRKWHITLGRWFREYVYIPLGGNRKGKVRQVINTFIVWFLTGLWHGADWNFIIWGLFYFVIISLEKVFYLEKIEKSKIIGHVYMLILIPVSWVIFNITDLSELGMYLKRMFFLPVEGTVDNNQMEFFLTMVSRYWWLLLICAACCTKYPMKIVNRFKDNILFKLVMLGIFWLCTYRLLTGANNPFLYFRF